MEIAILAFICILISTTSAAPKAATGSSWMNSNKFQGDINSFDQKSFEAYMQQYNSWGQGLDEPDDSGRLSSAIGDPRHLWDNGRIPYVIAPSKDPLLQKVIKEAMQIYHNKTCIRFVPRKSERDYLYITDSRPGDCSSLLGNNRTGMQELFLSGTCNTLGTALHELMHAIGFWHEQQRADRDNYINVIMENIWPGKQFNYKKASLNEMLLIGRYDPNSIMHYKSGLFARVPGEETMVRKDNGKSNFGGEMLTDEDIRKIRSLYHCGGAPTSQLCGTLYENKDFKGKSLSVTSGYYNDHLSAQWDNIFTSSKEQPGCELILCVDDKFATACVRMRGNQMLFSAEYQDKISSVRCTCNLCSDTNENCGDWAKKGECKKNPGFMFHTCYKSCFPKKCTPTNAIQTGAAPGSAYQTG